ncbi:enoyl-[acyl-carrier-protein] reductase FabV [Streptomyces sp. NBC_00536]|uniref:enoyl-[acyl-carrier-protein] reductase FabV n=1 Tax=Streptomyces sp. NBC_00536 TaxID=2975769 RepID=UPI002E80D13E|nr:enoyl-[acyl-carrier-protein] reductase FabV [Streptomyces sp. NBC_00536]WUC83033.1 enoyl-[acyl-carrier-protein] reductase FabV [Streptomyces sp. NBC_00536]
MSLRQIDPKQRGFLIVNSHPTGSAETVTRMWDKIPARTDGSSPVVLLLGHSAGYGLATLLTGLRRHGIRGVGVAYEGAETERRTATAGWYRTAAAARLAAEVGSDFVFVNTDAFSEKGKAEVLDLVKERFGTVDYLIYSLAAPRRTDPVTGTVHHSVIKPLGQPYQAPALDFSDGTAKVSSIRLEPATEDETYATEQVMGGADWQLWVEALAERSLLADRFTTVALTYIGSELTAPVYRQGTIGAAKKHLENTAGDLNDTVLADGQRAFTVVAGAAVTQASSAIPSIALYTAFLHTVLGDRFRTTAQQAEDLWDQLTGTAPLVTDEQGRIRLDGWELDPKVQDQVRELWADPQAGLASAPAGAAWFMSQLRDLYGWGLDGIDYDQPDQTTVAWPTPQKSGVAQSHE